MTGTIHGGGLAHALEGNLPPCLRVAVFEGWRARWWDSQACQHNIEPGEGPRTRFVIVVDTILTYEPEPYHPEIDSPTGWRQVGDWVVWTDDPEEAEALWAEACERLREVGRE